MAAQTNGDDIKVGDYSEFKANWNITSPAATVLQVEMNRSVNKQHLPFLQ
jgi:hypothetical protein